MTVSVSSGHGSKNLVKIVANIFISFIGAGVLGLPFAFKEAGVIEGTVIMSLVGIISVKAMLLLVDCKHMLTEKDAPSQRNGYTKDLMVNSEEVDSLVDNPSNGHATHEVRIVHVDEPTKPKAAGHQDMNYGDVGFFAVGWIGQFLVDTAIIVSQIGFCCAYLIFISENLSMYFPSMTLIHWLAVLLPPLYLLTLLRHLSSLAVSSLFAQMSSLMAFAVVFWYDFEHFSQVEIHPKKMSVHGFPFFLAIAIYCYEGAGMILSLESSLAAEIRHKFKLYFVMTITAVTLLYISFGVCGYLSFGQHTDEIITLNLESSAGSSVFNLANIVKAFLCLSLFFTYPMMMFPVVKLLEIKVLPDPDKIWQGNVLRLLMVGLTGLIVCAIPNFSTLMALVGATCCTMLAFTLPGLFHLQISRKVAGRISRWAYAFDIFLMWLGVVGTIIGTWDAVSRLGDAHAVHYTPPPIEDGNQTSLLNLTTIPAVHITVSPAKLPQTLTNLINITKSPTIT